MDQQLQQMTAAMEELKKQLLLSELASIERENALKEQSRREKEELKRTVQKMREEFQQERMLQELQNIQNGEVSNNNSRLRSVSEMSEKSSEKCRSGNNSRRNSKTAGLHTPIKSVLSMNRIKSSSPSGSPTNITTPTAITTTVPTNRSASNSRRNSRFIGTSPGSPSIGAKHLASHRSLFDLLTLDYNAQMQNSMTNTTGNNVGVNILDTTTTIPSITTNQSTNSTASTSGKTKHTFSPHTVHVVEHGPMQFQRATSYHKITLPTTEEVDEQAGTCIFIVL